MSSDRYVPEREVSSLTGLALPTLRNYRATHQGPPYIKIGRAVRYSIQDVRDWMDSRKVTPSGEAD